MQRELISNWPQRTGRSELAAANWPQRTGRSELAAANWPQRTDALRGTAFWDLAILASVIILWSVHCTQAEQPLPANNVPNPSPVERFKLFLSSPPVVESLIFSERLPPDPQQPGRTDIPVSASLAFRYYQARWQPGAYFLREIAAPNAQSDLKTPGLLAVRFNEQCWFHFGHGYGSIDRLESGSYFSNDVCQTAFNNSSVLRQVMTFGLMHSDAGSVEWRGNQFRVRTPALGLRITGELNVLASGLVQSLKVTYFNAKGEIHWLISYSYATNQPVDGLPSTIRCFWLNGSKELQLELSLFPFVLGVC